MNFASKRNCLRCQEARPKRQLNPGEWECPSYVSISPSQVQFDWQIDILIYDYKYSLQM